VDLIGRLRAALGEMAANAYADMAREGIEQPRVQLHALLDMRYAGQAYELTVPFVPSGKRTLVIQRFHEAHEHTYGHALPNRAVEVINLRLQAVGLVDKPQLTPEDISAENGAAPFYTRKDDIALYERESLAPGARFSGAALVFQMDSTVYIPVGWSAKVDGYQNLILEHAP
jgi:N-methylhydantoinase A